MFFCFPCEFTSNDYAVESSPLTIQKVDKSVSIIPAFPKKIRSGDLFFTLKKEGLPQI
jgi:hypothetical protein